MTRVYLWDGTVHDVPDSIFTKKDAGKFLGVNDDIQIAAVRVDTDRRPIFIKECTNTDVLPMERCKEKCTIEQHDWNAKSIEWAFDEWQCQCTLQIKIEDLAS